MSAIEGKASRYPVALDVGASGIYKTQQISHLEKIVKKTFLAMMKQMGYDVRLTYDKRV